MKKLLPRLMSGVTFHYFLQEKKETIFLHLRKARPMLRGLSFLPTFHVMVLPSENDPYSSEYTVQLMTYTGKVVMEDQIVLQPSGQVRLFLH